MCSQFSFIRRVLSLRKVADVLTIYKG